MDVFGRQAMTGFDAVRLFRTQEHAEQFVRGKLFMTRLSIFREAEDERKGVGDSCEGRRAAMLPEGARLFIDVSNIGVVESGENREREWMECPKSTNEPFLTFSGCDDAFILCATDISAALVPCDQDNQVGQAFTWSTDYLEFEGQYEFAVLFRIEEVKMRLLDFAKSRGLHFLSGPVEYSDDVLCPEETLDAMCGPVDAREFILRKRTKFSNQNEYRFALLPTSEMVAQGKRLEVGKEHLDANVGPIASSLLVPVEVLHSVRFRKKEGRVTGDAMASTGK